MRPSLVIIGLGNPGKSYAWTRHNAGFRAVEILSKEYGVGEWQFEQKFKADTQEARIVTVPVLLVKPRTYMNLCGEAVQKLITFFKLNSKEQALVICDDVDIPLGTVRIRKTGGPGTHNGLKSVVDQVGEEFPRLRIGIGPQPLREHDLAAWVLSHFSEEEEGKLEETLKKIPEAVREFVLGDSKETNPSATRSGSEDPSGSRTTNSGPSGKIKES